MKARFTTATALAGLLAALTPVPIGAQAANAWRIAIIGDSLATGYGISREAAYPAVLEQLARSEGWPVKVGVWGLSGNTTRDGIADARGAAAWAPHVAVVALGGNDALQGATAASVRINVERMLTELQPYSGYLLVAAMRAPPLRGEAYGERFHRAFRNAAGAYRAAWMPFLLDGVAGRPELNQPDGVHPNEAGAQIIGANLWAYVRDALHTLLQRDAPQ